MSLDFSRCRLTPFAHQREDTERLINSPFFFITSEMRTGKTKIVIDAAQFLYEANKIDQVIVIAPAPVRDVWADPDLGEIAKHTWLSVGADVIEYHSPSRMWRMGSVDTGLRWIVTNYEYIASESRLEKLLQLCGEKTLLVLDESSYVKNHKAERTKACMRLRKACGRVVLLNGTPIYHSPLDLFSQGNLLDPSILECKFITHYKARYAVETPILRYGGKPMINKWGKPIVEIKSWTNLDELQKRFAPYTVRRLQAECLDLPPKLEPVILTATLTNVTWFAYKEMRDELVVWLQNGSVAASTTAAVKTLRLAQITSGFLGGIEATGLDDGPEPETTTQEIGREKLDVLLWFLEQQLEADPHFKVVVWHHFRPELFRTLKAVAEKFPQFEVAGIHGGQKKEERIHALSLLKPETSPKDRPVFVGGTAGTGSFGLDFTAAHTCVTMSADYSPGRTAQMLDRVYGPGQTEPIAFYEIVASGPKGQRTIDHQIAIARRAGEDLATWTASAWVAALTKD